MLSQPFIPSGPNKLELILYPRKAVYNTMRQKTILTCWIKLYKISDGILSCWQGGRARRPHRYTTRRHTSRHWQGLWPLSDLLADAQTVQAGQGAVAQPADFLAGDALMLAVGIIIHILNIFMIIEVFLNK